MLNKITILTLTLLCSLNLQAMNSAEMTAAQPAGQVEAKQQFDAKATEDLKKLVTFYNKGLHTGIGAQELNKLLEKIIQRDADVNTLISTRIINGSPTDMTILNVASRFPIYEPTFYQILLKAKANPFTPCEDGSTPLQTLKSKSSQVEEEIKSLTAESAELSAICAQEENIPTPAQIRAGFNKHHIDGEIERLTKIYAQQQMIIKLLEDAQKSPVAPPALPHKAPAPTASAVETQFEGAAGATPPTPQKD